LVIHCQVITSQVMAYRPDRDRPVIGRPVPDAAVGYHQWQRKVILTTLSVKDRYFGRVTARAGREPARAGHEPAVRWREGPAEGRLPGAARGRMSGAGTQEGDHFGRPARDRRCGTENRDLRPPLRHINWPGVRLPAGRRPGPDAIAGHSMPSVNRWLARLCECLPDCRPGLASQPARPGSGPLWAARPGSSRPARVPGFRRRGPPPGGAEAAGGGYSRVQRGLLPRVVLRTGICPGHSDARQVFA
jgi:hypothetical protein